MNKYQIPAEMVEELPDAVEEAFSIEQEPELPNRPLEENEVLGRFGPGQLVNRTERQHLVRLYDREGLPRLFLRELVPLALAQGDPVTGERYYFARPPKEAPKLPHRCPVKSCGKQLAARRDVRVHVEGYHQAWWQEQQLIKKRREANARRRQEQAMLGLLATLVKRNATADIPDENTNRGEILSWLRAQTGTWDKSWMSLSKEELLEVARAFAAAREHPEIVAPVEEPDIIDELEAVDAEEAEEWDE